jgi:hypothetical protein
MSPVGRPFKSGNMRYYEVFSRWLAGWLERMRVYGYGKSID